MNPDDPASVHGCTADVINTRNTNMDATKLLVSQCLWSLKTNVVSLMCLSVTSCQSVYSVNLYSTTKSSQIKTSVMGDMKLLLLDQHIHQGRPGVSEKVWAG